MNPYDPSPDVLSYGRPRGFYRPPLMVRAWRRLPKPSPLVAVSFVATVLAGWWLYTDHAPWVKVRTLPGPASYSAGGNTAATVGSDPGRPDYGIVEVFDTGSGGPVATPPRQADPGVSLSPDGMRIAATVGTRRGVLWDARTPAEIASWTVHPDRTLVRFAPDGRRIVSVGTRGLELRDGHTGAHLFDLGPPPGPKGWFKSYFSSDGGYFAAVVAQDVIVWRTDTGAEVLRVNAPDDELLDHAFLGPTKIAVKLYQFVKVYDLPTGRLLETHADDDYLITVWGSPDGRHVYFHELSEFVLVWASGTGVSPSPIRIGQQSLYISGDGSAVLTVSPESATRLQLRRADGALLEEFDVAPPTEGEVMIEDVLFLGGSDRRIAVHRHESDGTGSSITVAEVWYRQRPARWYGFAWLPQFWAWVGCGGTLLWSIVRRIRRRRRAGREDAPRA